MTTRYLDFETVAEINAEYGGDGAGVRDEPGIRAALGRASATFMGLDLVPSLAAKAAVILHGLSSTQYFHDGNKRTAWLASKLFLELNGAPLRQIPTVNSEAFVVSIATKGFETPEDGAQPALDKAAEWFTHARFRMRDRLDYAIVSSAAQRSVASPGTFEMTEGQLGGFATSGLPVVVPVAAVVRLKFRREDAYRDWNLRIHAEPDGGPFSVVSPGEELSEHLLKHGTLPDDFDITQDMVGYTEGQPLAYEDIAGVHESGVQPAIGVYDIMLYVTGTGQGELVFTLNGEFLARRLLVVRHAPEFGDTAAVAEALAKILAPE